MKNISLIVFTLLILNSCLEKGKVQIENKIHNVKLMNVRWNGEIISYELYPGESSDEIIIMDKRDKFPKTSAVEFTMIYNDKRVFLRTKQKYSLDYDEKLLIVLHDTTKVYNPATE